MGQDLYFYRYSDSGNGGSAVTRFKVGMGGWETLSRVSAQLGGDDNAPKYIYGIKGDDLLWYRHNDWQSFGSNFDRQKVGAGGWNAVKTVSAAGNGILYAVTPQGDLVWYRHRDWQNGAFDQFDKRTVGFGGWSGFKSVFAGGEGIIYAVTPQGDLMWYRHKDWQNGAVDQFDKRPVGFGGWNSFKSVFAGGDGIIYGVTPQGDLMWHRHKDWQNGAVDQFDKQKVGFGGWNALPEVFGGGRGTIYGTLEGAAPPSTEQGRCCWVALQQQNPDGTVSFYDTWVCPCPGR